MIVNKAKLRCIVKPGSRSKVYLKSLRDLDLELVAMIAMYPPTHPENFYEQNDIEIFMYELISHLRYFGRRSFVQALAMLDIHNM